jgi:hypothetical protein
MLKNVAASTEQSKLTKKSTSLQESSMSLETEKLSQNPLNENEQRRKKLSSETNGKEKIKTMIDEYDSWFPDPH